LDIYLVRSVVNGSVYDTQKYNTTCKMKGEKKTSDKFNNHR